MTSCHQSQPGIVLVEGLECRVLMSTVTLTQPDGMEAGELGGTKVAIAAGELPSLVSAKLLARFPEAKLTETAIEARRGALSYIVGAAVNGREVDMAMTRTGQSLSSDLPELRSANVRLIEVDTTAPDPVNVPVHPGDLPSHVTDAIVDRFPSAQLIGAEFSRTAESGEFGIVAQVGARVLDATVTPRGNIIETSELLPSGELPQAVLAWVEENFGSGAGIDRAEVVVDRGVPGYQVVVAPPGSQALEATLRVGDVPPRRDPEDSPDKHSDEPATDRLVAPASFNPTNAPSTPPDNYGQSDESPTGDPAQVSDSSSAAVSDRQGTHEPSEPTHNPIGPQPRIANDPAQNGGGTELLIGGSQVSPEASPPHVTAPRSRPFLPEVARELARVGPLDISRIGVRLRSLLRCMEGFATCDGHPRTRGVAAAGATVTFAVAVAVAAACVRLVPYGKRRRQGHALPSFCWDSTFGCPCAAPRARTWRTLR